MPYRRQIALCRIALIYAALLGPPAIAQQQDVEEVLVSGSFIPDEKLDTSEVSEVMNADDMSIAGDSNIGDALKRLPGLSLVGGKFIYVRGLGERYSSTYFNGTLMPGIEPLKRAVPLDLFDASITSNVLVQKTFSTNYGADFSGGVVDIRSAALPNESFFKIKYGTGYNSYSTGETSLGYAGGSEDWLGRDDGRRDLPRPLVETAGLYPNQFGSVDFGISDIEQRDRARFSFSNNVWTVRPETAPYDQSFGLGGGLRLPLRDDLSLGVLAVLNYDHKTRNRFTERSRWGGGAFAPGFFQSDSQAKTLRDNALQFGDDKLDPADPADAYTAAKISSVSNYDRTVAEIGLTGLFAVGLEFRDVHNVKLTQMILRKTTDEASVREYRASTTTAATLRRTTRLEWVENEIQLMQLSGEHALDSMTINWRYAEVDGARDTPDAREHTLVRDNDNSTATAGQFGFAPTIVASATRPVREYTELDDQAEDLGIDFAIPLYGSGNFLGEMTLKIGASSYEKERSYEAIRFEYVLDDLKNVNANPFSFDANYDPIYFGKTAEVLLDPASCVPLGDDEPLDDCFLAENDNGGSAFFGNGNSSPHSIDLRGGFQTGRPDAYQGQTRLDARYFSLDMKVLPSLRANIGIRQERSTQTVTPASAQGASFDTARLAGNYSLPAVSMTWDFIDNMQLRMAYSETINRPILRELSEVRVYNPDDGEQYRGNPELQIAEITNWDLRYEWYFGDADYLSLSLFKKNIKNPIELARDDIGDGDVLSWLNIPSASNEGVEFEIRKYLGDFFFFTANASYIDSETEGAPDAAVLEDPNRPLQGLSKELYNAQFVFESDFNTTALSWNKFSERIFAVSNVAGEIYEQPFESLNLNSKWRVFFSDYELALTAKATNLLGEKVEFLYKNGLPYDNYEVGKTYSLSVELKGLPK